MAVVTFSPSLLELWRQSTDGTPWAQANLERELRNVEKLATRPRIPDDHLIFRVFRAFDKPQEQIKVVILGQDPYPEILRITQQATAGVPAAALLGDGRGGEDQGRRQRPKTIEVTRACGFAFSSPLGKLPLSLRTIITEIIREYLPSSSEKATDYSGDLCCWISEGVFLLNSLLTLEFDGEKGVALSHSSWVSFTTQILNYIRRTCPRVVYLAFGKKAADLLKASGITDAIECDHPANRFSGRNPFIGSNIFTQANELLQARGVEPVNWIPMKNPIDVSYYDSTAADPCSP